MRTQLEVMARIRDEGLAQEQVQYIGYKLENSTLSSLCITDSYFKYPYPKS